MKNTILKGVGVALATPFHRNGQIDFSSLTTLVEHAIEGGVDFLVALGTTAEAPTLTDKERLAVVESIIDANNGRLPCVLGIGGNNTSMVLEQIKAASYQGINYLLSIAPYYNKPNQEGLFRHYQMIAENSPVPVIAYNIPSRTGVNMEVSTILRLANEVENLVAIKEASGNLLQIMDVIHNKPANFKVFSGDDAMTFSILALGGDGVISTTANVLPKEMSNMVHAFQNGDIKAARAKHYELLNMMRLLFAEGSPSGLKAALEIKNLAKNNLRLPLTKVSKNLYNKMVEQLELLEAK
ncbi:MAG: 4-hydroxy-tetrahydrodipicolinate synthase [Bacteroidales bacterium]